MTIDLTDIDTTRAVTIETLEEDGIYAILIATDDDEREPVIDFEGLTESQSATAFEFAEKMFPRNVQID